MLPRLAILLLLVVLVGCDPNIQIGSQKIENVPTAEIEDRLAVMNGDRQTVDEPEKRRALTAFIKGAEFELNRRK